MWVFAKLPNITDSILQGSTTVTQSDSADNKILITQPHANEIKETMQDKNKKPNKTLFETQTSGGGAYMKDEISGNAVITSDLGIDQG